MTNPLEEIAPDLWVATRPLRIPVGDVGARMTILRLPDGGLILHSPVDCDPATREAVDGLGEVRWIIGPNKKHHFYLASWAAIYPEALLGGPVGLAEKRTDLPFSLRLPQETPEPWTTVDLHLVEGAPGVDEVVFFHRPSRTLILTDLAFHRPHGLPDGAWLFHRIVGAHGRFGPHRLMRWFIRDRAATARSIRKILEWDFDRIIVSHGAVLETDGRAKLREAFSFLAR